jgi:succinyl-CoA synthetase alpha subunit
VKAQTLENLLKKGDRVAVSNVTGREASQVSFASQLYCGNIVAGWALGRGGQRISVPKGTDIRVFGQFEDLMNNLPDEQKPNKIIVYSPPDAVYGDVKEVIEHGKRVVETIFVITEHVSVEVTAKLKRLCDLEGIDIVGCNTLGMINAHDRVRVGAVGGESPDETFLPGSACIISNSGNMVNTIASYLQSAGLGVSSGIATGKDVLILTPLRELLVLADRDERTRIIVLYVEPGGTYELSGLEWARENQLQKPLLVYVAGSIVEGTNISLGHAGAVVEGKDTSAAAKMALFDDYFGVPVFDPEKEKETIARLAQTRKGIRVNTLHDLVPAAAALMSALELKRDFIPTSPLVLKPWLVGLGSFTRKLPRELVPHVDAIIEPYGSLIKKYIKASLGRSPARQPMRNVSHASSNDGLTPRVYGYSLLKLMEGSSFVDAVLLCWLGYPVKHAFESKLVQMCLVASITNGPGTISAQAAKLAACAGNDPNTAMMATLGAIGAVHGGNGKKAARMLIEVFGPTGLTDPYSREAAPDLDKLVRGHVSTFKKKKSAAKDAGIESERIPCLGHPVFNTERVNYDPRERVIHAYMEQHGIYNVFLDFYHRLAQELMTQQATTKVHAVNIDAAITCVLMGIAWPLLVDNKISVERTVDLPFLAFALGRVAGGAGEYLDHRESGTAMDMRVPVAECRFIGRRQD